MPNVRDHENTIKTNVIGFELFLKHFIFYVKFKTRKLFTKIMYDAKMIG